MSLSWVVRDSSQSACRRTRLAIGAGLAAAVAVLSFVVPMPTGATGPDVLLVLDSRGGEHSTWVNDDLTPTGAFGSISMFDADVNRLAATDLVGIEVVIVQTNWGFVDADEAGDLLADFVDGGGRVIVMAYAFPCTLDENNDPVTWGLGGRWESAVYAPLVPRLPRGDDCDQYLFPSTVGTMQIVNQSSPYLSGVGLIETGTDSNGPIAWDLNSDLVVAQGADLIATWDVPGDTDADGEPMVAVGSNCVMAVNAWPPGITYFSQTSRSAMATLVKNLATLSCTRSDSTSSSSSSSSSTTEVSQESSTSVTPATESSMSETSAPTASTADTVSPSTDETAAPSSSVSAPVASSQAPTREAIAALPESTSLVDAAGQMAPGQAMSVSVAGFVPGEAVHLVVAAEPQIIATGVSDSDGSVSLSGTIPMSLESGSHTIAVYAPVSGRGFRQPITVTAVSLPATGDDGAAPSALAALLAIAFGGAAIILSRRSAAHLH